MPYTAQIAPCVTERIQHLKVVGSAQGESQGARQGVPGSVQVGSKQMPSAMLEGGCWGLGEELEQE